MFFTFYQSEPLFFVVIATLGFAMQDVVVKMLTVNG